jgi:multicomponent Na+:H+ antiporter subunit D
MMSNLPISLFVVPFVGSLLAAALGWVARGAARWVAAVTLTVTAGLAIAAVPRVLAEGSLHTHTAGWPPPIGIEVLLDPLSAFIAAVVGVVALIVVVGSAVQVHAELSNRETAYYASVLLLVSGLMGMVITGDLFNMFVHVEVVSISAYALVAAGGRGAPHAALNYLVVGSLGASLYLMGVGFLYAATGSLNMADVAGRIAEADPRLVVVAGLLIVSGLGVKMALFPLHVWMPAAYSRSPTVVASLMAPLVTKVSAYALIRILFWVFGGGSVAVDPVLLEVLMWAGAAAIVGGGVLALVQSDLRRMLVYSSVGQMGIVALGAGLANTDGIVGAVMHIANDALMKGALFLAAGVALLRFGVRNIDDLNGLRGRAPWTTAVIVVAGLSLVGIPPLSGFFGKWYVLSGALAAERWIFAAALVIGSLATIGYVFRVFERLFFAPPHPDSTRTEGNAGVLAACAVLALLIVAVGVLNQRIVTDLLYPALPAMTGVATGGTP